MDLTMDRVNERSLMKILLDIRIKKRKGMFDNSRFYLLKGDSARYVN